MTETFTSPVCCEDDCVNVADTVYVKPGYYPWTREQRDAWRLCSECVDTKFEECAHCNRIEYKEFVTQAFEEPTCRDCRSQLYVCERCENDSWADDTHTVSGPGYSYTYCQSCYDRHAHYCDSCDENHLDDDEPCSNGVIESYSYRPSPKFRWIDARGDEHSSMWNEPTSKSNPDCPPEPVFMGFELEVESGAGTILEGARAFGNAVDSDHLYLKEDSSLNNGFEIVTHPSTLAYYYNMRSLYMGPINRLSNEFGFVSWRTRTCGFHIHVSRQAFKDKAHLWRFAYFINENPRYVSKLAGRHSDQWATFSGQKRKASKVIAGKDSRPDRYTAVNLCNYNTVEIRVFRGSLLPRRIFANLGFVDAVVRFTRNVSVKSVNSQEMNWQKFTDFVMNGLTGEEYDSLRYYIKHYFYGSEDEDLLDGSEVYHQSSYDQL